MRRGRRVWLALAVAAAAGSAALRADDEQLPLRVWLFRLPGTELGLDVADMDADGQQDLVISHMASTTGPARSISVYLRGPQGQRFQAQPQRRFAVPQDACAFAAGDFDPAPGGEVVFLCPERVVLARGQGQLSEVLRVKGFFDYPEDGALPVWDLARDLDGDGRPELLVPTKDGYTVLARRGEGGLEQVGQVAIPVQNRFGSSLETRLLNRFLSARSRLRRVVTVDLDQDGRLDLVAYRKKGLARWLQRADGTFAEQPDAEAPLKLVEQAEQEGGKDKKQEQTEAFANVRLDLADVDQDGAAELIVLRTVGELGVFETIRTQLVMFKGRPGGSWDEDHPDLVLNLKGISADPELVDWDGDGRRDLVLSSYRMDLFTNFKRAITKTMTITYQIYLRSEEGLYPEEPSFLRDVEVELESLQRRGGTHAVEFGADLNGDGVNDMLVRRPEGGLTVSLGGYEEGVFSGPELTFDEDRSFPLTVGRTEPPRVYDLDGDGADELILEPFAGDDQASRTVRVVGLDR